MKTNKFSIDDIVVLRENDHFDDDNLSCIIGGMGGSCTCKCDSGNCYLDKDSTKTDD